MRNLGIVVLGTAGGCASSAADITPAYVSPVYLVRFALHDAPSHAREERGD
jgi:hypothetical protein